MELNSLNLFNNICYWQKCFNIGYRDATKIWRLFVAAFSNNQEFYFAEEDGGIQTERKLDIDFNTIDNDLYANNDELAYAINLLLRYFDRYNEGTTTKTRFNKLMYIMNVELIKNDINIHLPYFWYLYGPVIPLKFLPCNLIQLIKRPWGEGIKIDKNKTFRVNDNIKTKIEYVAETVYQNYGNIEPKIMTARIINSVYKIAPYSFQSKYKLFHYGVKRKLRDRKILLMMGPLKEANDIANLNDLVRAYDKSQFADVYRDLLRWKLLVYYQLKNLSKIEGNTLSALLDLYWYVFCQLLKAKCNSYLPEALIIKWNRQIPEEVNSYRERFKWVEEYFYSNEYTSNNSLNSGLYYAYNNTVIQMMRRDP